MIIERINKWLSNHEGHEDVNLVYAIEKMAGWSFKQQFFEVKENHKAGKLYLSHAGKCARQVAYGFHSFEPAGKELDSRSKIIFFQGDLCELMILSLAKSAGCNVLGTGFNQTRLVMPLKEGVEASGYPDGLLLSDGKIYLVEVKSYASYAFDRFEKGDIDEAYLAQINMYMHCLGVNECVMLGMNKDNGVLGERLIKADTAIFEAGRANLMVIADSTPESLPERKYTPNDKGFYPWQCLYCGYWQTCLPEVEKVLVSNRYQLKIKNLKKEKTQ